MFTCHQFLTKIIIIIIIIIIITKTIQNNNGICKSLKGWLPSDKSKGSCNLLSHRMYIQGLKMMYKNLMANNPFFQNTSGKQTSVQKRKVIISYIEKYRESVQHLRQVKHIVLNHLKNVKTMENLAY